MNKRIRWLLLASAAIFGADTALNIAIPWIGHAAWMNAAHGFTVGVAFAWLGASYVQHRLSEALHIQLTAKEKNR